MRAFVLLFSVLLLGATACSKEETKPKDALCAPWDQRVTKLGLPAFTEIRYGCKEERFQGLSDAPKEAFHKALVSAGYELRVGKKTTVVKARDAVIAYGEGGALYVVVEKRGKQGYVVSISNAGLEKAETIPVAEMETLTKASFEELRKIIGQRQALARRLLKDGSKVPDSCAELAKEHDTLRKSLVKVPFKPGMPRFDGAIFSQDVSKVIKRRTELEEQTAGDHYVAYLEPKIVTKNTMPEMIEKTVSDVVVGIVHQPNKKLLCRITLHPFDGKPDGEKRSLFDIKRTAKLGRDRLLGTAAP